MEGILLRECIDCGAKITACMGSVLVSSFLKYGRGETDHIQELCGKCTLKRIMIEDYNNGLFV